MGITFSDEEKAVDIELVRHIVDVVLRDLVGRNSSRSREMINALIRGFTRGIPPKPMLVKLVDEEIKRHTAIKPAARGWYQYHVLHELNKRREPKLATARVQRECRKRLERQEKRQGVLFPAVKPGRVYRPRQ